MKTVGISELYKYESSLSIELLFIAILIVLRIYQVLEPEKWNFITKISIVLLLPQ